METIIHSLVTSSGLCPDRVGGPEEPLVSDLEENLYLTSRESAPRDTEEDLHKGLVRMGVPDVTPTTFRRLTIRSAITSGVAASYGESADVEAWRAVVVHLAHRPTGSISNADMAMVLARIHLQLGC
ncbi:hypothetical protein BHM03_00003585 [Ensete ventricosum]|nr:hypothetical protein BHM03_00003585 [Ensete ventricosum]